jgi:hypothetical protein
MPAKNLLRLIGWSMLDSQILHKYFETLRAILAPIHPPALTGLSDVPIPWKGS